MTRIADAMVLVMTRGGSLASWRDAGVLEREWALYERIARHYERIVVAGYGDDEDREIARSLGGSPSVVCHHGACDTLDREADLPALVSRELGGVSCVVVKTNQFQGGDAAVSIARTLRSRGVCAALLARGGYDYSRGFAVRFGPASVEAIDAAGEEGRLLAQADRMVVTTDRIAELLAWRHGVDPSRFDVVPNYVDGVALSAPTVEREARTVLAVGRLDPQKRLDLLVDACALIGDVHLVIVGDGVCRDGLQARCREQGVDAVFLGQLDGTRVYEQMRRCGVFVQCSVWEGHPKTVREAQACGAPVVGVHAPGLSEAIEPEHTGLLARADASGLAQTMRRVLDDPGLGARLGAAARSSVMERCSLDRVADLELGAHRLAVAEAGSGCADDGVRVRWPSSAVRADPTAIAEGFGESLEALCARLGADEAERVIGALRARLDAHPSSVQAVGGGA